MKRRLGYLVQLGTMIVLAAPALAQTSCPEGRTSSGECVNPALAVSARQAAMLFAQPQISLTAIPILPAEDQGYRYPNGLIPNELAPTIGAGIFANSPPPVTTIDKP